MAADVGDPLAPDLRGLGIMQLLKQASRRRGSSSSSTSATAASTALGSSSGVGLEMAIARLTGSGAPPWDILTLSRRLRLSCYY